MSFIGIAIYTEFVYCRKLKKGDVTSIDEEGVAIQEG